MQAWRLCSVAGRDGMTGTLRIEAVIATIAALGGHQEDLAMVLVLEQIMREKEKESGGSES